MIVFNSLFKTPELEETTQQLANCLPNGRAWDNKNQHDSNIRKLIRSCAKSFNIIQTYIEHLAMEYDINLTSDLLPDWETSVGLPDSCLTEITDLVQRRERVITKLRKIPVVTKNDIETLIFEAFGNTIEVTPGADVEVFPLSFPLTFSSTSSRFKLYVNIIDIGLGIGFPYAFPYAFSFTNEDKIRCLIRSVIPANVILIIRYN